MPNYLQKVSFFFLSLVSGASLTLGFAPFSWWIFSFLSLISFIWLLDYQLISGDNNKIQVCPPALNNDGNPTSTNYRDSIDSTVTTNYCNSIYVAYLWGIGFFGTNVSWIFVSIYKYGGTNWFVAGLITAGFILYLATFPVLAVIILKKSTLLSPNRLYFVLAFPAVWTLLEMLRGWLFTGFPWSLLAYTQLNTWLKYYASYIGCFGVTFLVASIASLCYWGIYQKGLLKIFTVIFIFLLFLVGLILQKGISQQSVGHTSGSDLNSTIYHRTHKVAIVQANIGPDQKFAPQGIDGVIQQIKAIYWEPTIKLFTNNITTNQADNLDANATGNSIVDNVNVQAENNIGKHISNNVNVQAKNNISNSAANYIDPNNIDLIIWPENSLPVVLNSSQVREFLCQLDSAAKQYNFGLIIGAPVVLPNNYMLFKGNKINNLGHVLECSSSKESQQHEESGDMYNAIVALGEARGIYCKINLVPFGDYVPGVRWISWLQHLVDLPLSGFAAGSCGQPSILFKGNRMLGTICYDIVYANQLRQRVLNGNPSVIVTISEDGWFGRSFGPYQHLDIARMRAIETGRFVLRATTRGISAIIDQYGNIVKQTSMFTKDILLGSFQDCFHHTVWNKIGIIPIVIFLWIWLMIALLISRSRASG